MYRICGLELHHKMVKDQLQSKSDCVIAAVHCLLINEGLQCTGIGEEVSQSDKPSEMLPAGWNANQDVYTLRYTGRNSKTFLVKAVKTGKHILHINAVLGEDTTASMSVNVDKIVGDAFNEYQTAYLDLLALSNNFRSEILDKLIRNPDSSPSSLKSPDERRSSPRVPTNVIPGQNPREQPDPLRVRPSPDPLRVRPSPYPQVGSNDLDPFAIGGGGMLYDPLRRNPRTSDPSGFGVPPFGGPAGLPRGSIPPGARFDPFGPPMGGPPRPNPDHFKPPDFDEF